MSRKRYPRELKDRAVAMVLEAKATDPSDRGVFSRIARQLGVTDFSLRDWVKQAEIDGGTKAGITTSERDELKALKRENFELKRTNEILKLASAFFARELDPQPPKR